MKAVIKDVQFKKEYDSKWGKRYMFIVKYNDTTANYHSPKKEQDKFVEGEEAEFTEQTQEKDGRTYINVSPINKKFNRHIQKEQSRYSAFAVSYCKDLIVADKLPLQDWKKASKEIFDVMVELDKSIND